MPDRVTVPVLNSDGSQRIQNVVIDNMIVAVPVTMQIPIFRPVALGGDMNAVANAEYRVPLKGPFTLVFFADLGLNKIVFADQLRLDPEFLNGLNNEFQEAGFSNSFSIAPHTQDFRMSTGAELRARIPKVGVPVRFYWAWDPRIDDRYIQPPIVADRRYVSEPDDFRKRDQYLRPGISRPAIPQRLPLLNRTHLLTPSPEVRCRRQLFVIY